MSRIGKKPIQIPQGVDLKIEGNKVIVKGPKGELSREIRPEIKIEVKGNEVFVLPGKEKTSLSSSSLPGRENKKIKSFWGLTRMLVANMIEGVVSGFEKKLEIEGVGFRAEVSGEELILQVGFSHPVKVKIPKELNVSTERNIIAVSGINKQAVGQLASIIRKIKPAEPYKGKGIKYQGEQIRRKAGKKVATTGE